MIYDGVVYNEEVIKFFTEDWQSIVNDLFANNHGPVHELLKEVVDVTKMSLPSNWSKERRSSNARILRSTYIIRQK